ncbi:MAG: hypothetical protein KGH91_01585 [Rhodospirillales bacterium]|nr:hypothetical protein [Rhodospirillales bacterium]
MLWRGVPVPFDALEFDEELATIDLGYDLAFLLMDVDLRAARAAANAIFNCYIARTGDVALLSLLPLFCSGSRRDDNVRPKLNGRFAYRKLRPGSSSSIVNGWPGDPRLQ